MHFNKASLATLASNPKTTFEREGRLIFTECQEGIFRNSIVNVMRWCKLRGNLLFYQKDHHKKSTPHGLIVLERCRPVIHHYMPVEQLGYSFILEFEIGPPLSITAETEEDRKGWMQAIQLATLTFLDRQIEDLQNQLAHKMGNRIEAGQQVPADCHEALLMNSSAVLLPLQVDSKGLACTGNGTMKTACAEQDLCEVPICESALSCDNLRCDDNGRSPNARVICSVLVPGENFLWRDYARTEIVENSTSPQFLCTVRFRQSLGFNADTLLRFTVYDVREQVSATAVPIGYAEITLGVIQDASCFRIPLQSAVICDCGSITIASWAPDMDQQKTPPRSTTQVFEQQRKGHRRSQSLPPKLGTKLFVPYQGCIQRVFANPSIHTYRLHSNMSGDISVHESLLESKLCFVIPQQLLSIWIVREKELLQEISGMGELGGEWRRRQMDLLDKHLKLLKDYSQAKQNLQQLTKEDGHRHFKRSSVKTDESLEFIPVNLHLQRMWSQNDNLNRSGVLDVITVGAFTRHAGRTRTGGLIKLLQTKESPSKLERHNDNACKVHAANDAVQSIKQLRKEIVQIMSELLHMAKCKKSLGMMPLCNKLITKTKTLLNIWEPSLVEEAFAFVEQHRILDEPDNVLMPMSPFRKITQQLGALDLKSPELEDFATPVVAPPDLWPRTSTNSHYTPGAGRLVRANSLLQLPTTSPSLSSMDISAINALHRSVKIYSDKLISNVSAEEPAESMAFQSLPPVSSCSDSYESETAQYQLVDWDEEAATASAMNGNLNFELNSDISNPAGMAAYMPNGLSVPGANEGGCFLDTRIMSTSPSANYYRPTEEPEPLDLTQLNIEASVMCLVSKIKFFCGRCGSPAIRLRHPKQDTMRRAGFANSYPAPDVVANQSGIALGEESRQEMPPTSDAASLPAAAAAGGPREGNGLSLDLTRNNNCPAEAVSELRVKRGNKFTDGLDLSLTDDWMSELRPSMRKLRHAMDGLLKTARLMHSVQRLQQDMKRNSINLEIMYRRDVCFSQALTALVSALLARFWGCDVDENFVRILCDLGPLAYFEGLLSLYGGEVDMWGDMCIAVEDLSAVDFTLVRCNSLQGDEVPMPRVTGSRQALNVLLPVPEHIFNMLPASAASSSSPLVFKVTPVFFNIGINEKATLAETLGQTREQHRSNWDNYERLKQYYSRYHRKLNQYAVVDSTTPTMTTTTSPPMVNKQAAPEVIRSLLTFMAEQLHANVAKNVKILHLAEDACRLMSGLRFTSCKSAKDRTGMAVTLEQCRVLVQEFQLQAKIVPNVLNTMRSEGTRMDNVHKNIDKRKYAFNMPQVYSLPNMYRPPVGSYGKAET